MSETGPTGPAPGRNPEVAVVVTHYKALDALKASLGSVRDHADLSRTEVVVADSEVQPGTAALVQEMVPGAAHLGFAGDVGYAVSVNAALAQTSAPYILILNADVRIEDDTIPGLLAALEADPQLGLVSPLLAYDDGTLQPSAFRFYQPSTVMHRRSPTGRTARGQAALAEFEAPGYTAALSSTPVHSDWVLGAAVMVRRSALGTVGLLDTRYFMYFEDVDWCLRFWHAGWSVAVVPTAHARHTYGRASRGKGPMALFNNSLARVHLRSSIAFFRQHGLHPTRIPPSKMLKTP